MTIASFVEVQLDVGVDYGAVGGPTFNTTIIEMGSGREKRNVNHSSNLAAWDLGSRAISKSSYEYLRDFYRARRGRAQGFRYKDWSNYEATDQDAYPDGSPTLQLVKDYTSGSETDLMTIQKPISTGYTMERNAASFTDFTLDDTTGIITLDADSTATISNVTKANPGVVTTSSAHGYSSADEIHLDAIVGMTELNDTVVTITVLTTTTFSIAVDTTAYTTYSSAGTANKYVQSSEALTWSGEFDTPARFDTDQFRAELLHYRESDKSAAFQLESLPVVGLKL